MEENRIEDVIRSQFMPSVLKTTSNKSNMKKEAIMICRNEIEKKQSSTEELKQGSPGRRRYSKAVDIV